jgi:hypothetical protein
MKMPGIGPTEIVLIFVIAAVFVLPFWRIFAKAGFPGALSLLFFVPIVNIFLLFFLAFAEWPALQDKANPK